MKNSFPLVCRFSSIPFLALAASFCLSAGCDRSNVPTYTLVPVSGTVTMGGSPLADADVQFIFAGEMPPKQYVGSTGKTDASGKYELVTNAQKGCVEGKFKVVISKYTDRQGNPVQVDPEGGIDLEQLIQQGEAVQSIPPQYSDTEKTTLNTEVTAGKADGYDFVLTK